MDGTSRRPLRHQLGVKSQSDPEGATARLKQGAAAVFLGTGLSLNTQSVRRAEPSSGGSICGRKVGFQSTIAGSKQSPHDPAATMRVTQETAHV